ncbi:hypothetical protein D9757_006294 [Collybiopsis confluens]|uniref:Uncharacterized protein n=1 Tax=Collybiopsis confluens TaxID=2823264 RepID=A0A8H5HGQ8_9AGAR|nr:hypothetical protein D9757_006294 [Collybiopsis confluens]
MAHTDQHPSTLSEASSVIVAKELESPVNAVLPIHSSSTSSVKPDALDSKGSPALLNNPQTASLSRPTLVQLGFGTTPTAPHPKKYSASNINKKFLEKNSASPFPISSSSASVKPGAKPTIQSSASSSSTLHPRLVTTKLTATAQLSPSPGPGWSRPSSVTPPVANPSPNGAPTPSQASASTSLPAAPQLPHAGKVIQPQPRSFGLAQAVYRDGGHAAAAAVGAKPAWGKTSIPATAASATRADPRTQSDFPTAAEVAQVRKPKPPREKESEMAEASKQARMEEADTFRGVHLDPNAHHWDDMEEDDDNFLDGVIEFGDGRQYKIDTNTDSVPSVASPPLALSQSNLLQEIESTEPVSKEERFADDFDRSWPRTRPPPATSAVDFVPPPASSRASSSTSPTTLYSAHSPVETSRVLFNERSNRLEPYSNARASIPQGSDPRLVRNSAISRSSSNNSQVLQKPGPGEAINRSRGPVDVNEKQREREGSRRDVPPHQQQQMAQRTLTHPNSHERDIAPEHRGRRLSNMGPPPVPPHTANRPSSFRDGTRQLPPHLAHPILPSISPTTEQRQSSRDSRYSARPPSSAGQSSLRHPSQSPVLSHSTASPVISKIESSVSAPQLSGPQLEEVTKDLMQTAAARAKQRRQQEEEEREKEKERARRKAAELEVKLSPDRVQKEKAMAKKDDIEKINLHFPQDPKVSTIIQESVSSVQSGKPPPTQVNGVSSAKPRRPQSAWASSSSSQTQEPPPFVRKTSSFTSPPSVAPSDSTESWRTKPHAPLIQTSQQLPPAERPRAMSFATPPPSALDQVESISELEVVDYSDLGKFVGVTESFDEQSEALEKSEIAAAPASPAKARRPVASDFFEDVPPSTSAVAEPSSTASARPDTSAVWRTRKLSRNLPSVTSPRDEPQTNSGSDAALQPTSQSKDVVPEVLPSTPSKPLPVEKISAVTSTSTITPRRNQYKEAAMSALDDAMSRIKGALDVMHEEEQKVSPPELSPKRPSAPPSSLLPPKPDRWIPPAFRGEPQPTEPFSSTRSEPPKSPKPAWNVFTINLPKTSTHREAVDRNQMAAFNKFQPFRWDVLSFIPPVDGMSKKELSLNSVLFQKSYFYRGYKGKSKFPVSLPKVSHPTLKVNLPSPAPARPALWSMPSTGAFGKPTGADGASSWRKSTKANVEEEAEVSSGLNTTSRSPPPEPDPEPAPQTQKMEETPSESEDNSSRARARSQPKMPEGSGVAFYRGAVLSPESGLKPSVTFFATMELEIPSTVSEPESAQTIIQDVFPVRSSVSGIRSSSPIVSKPSPSPPSSQFGLPSLIHSAKTESNKSSDDSVDQRVPITPPTHHTWVRPSLGLSAKDSPIRGPDPEHLRAVWSQTSNQPGLHPVNSLDGITDELPSVPFTIQDVKSEDGETPPPTNVTTSRMSLHDVTRAFQQVPSSSGMAPHRPTISPPSTTAPVARPTPSTSTAPYAYHHPPPPVQPPNQSVRPQYAPFHPMSHSPAPGAMYTHSSARMPVNGHTPMYSPPMWMSMQSPNTQHSPMIRPMTAASYPMMPYHPSPGSQTMYSMPAPNMPPPPPSQPNGTPTRGSRPVSMMSPSHAPIPPMPMYPGSPGMMPMHAGRGAGSTQNRNDGSHQHQHQHQHPPQSFAPAGTFNGSRPPW